MPTSTPPEPTLERLRWVAAKAQFFGHDRLARVVTGDGGVYTGRGLAVLYDELIVGPVWRADAIHLPLAVVARIERYELRVKRALVLGAAVATLGGVLGAWHDVVTGDPLRYRDGLLLGVILGAMAAPFVVWLAQGIPGLKRWRVVLDERDV